MPRITVDGQEYEVNERDNLLQACLSHGLDLPYFCWHPAMDSVGACRQCAVVQYADENDERGRLTMACMTPVQDGARIAIGADHAVDFRASVIEWLMENHPHDCPVCEEGGECHLQDMTVMTGHTSRVYRGNKRTFENQYLGPLINHEMNRCITCYRCVRFYRDYAGGEDLAAFGSRARMYFGRAEPGVLESEFSGNLVEVCPTGVFTDKPFSSMYTRKWDLQSAPSVCTGCAVGCNLHASERYGVLKRVHNRYHPDINRYFICDRGRFGAAYTNSESRMRFTGAGQGEGLFRQIPPADATTQAAELLAQGTVVGIGSPRMSMEDNFALRALVGENNFSPGIGTHESACLDAAAAAGRSPPSLVDVEAADAVLVLGEDLLNTAPRVALALRQATRNLSYEMAAEAAIPAWQEAGVQGHAQHASNPFYSATIAPTRLDDLATATTCGAPEDLVRLANELAGALGGTATDNSFVAKCAEALGSAKQPLIVTGTSCASPALINAAARVASALDQDAQACAFLVCGAEANTFGAHRLGGMPLEDALDRAAEGLVHTLVIAGNDLYRRAPEAKVSAALNCEARILVLDALDNATANAADLVFPAATAFESTGTLVNYEGRAQRFYQVFQPADDIRPLWSWVEEIASAGARSDCRWQSADQVLQELTSLADFASLRDFAPHETRTGRPVPRQSHRYSGRTAMNAGKSVHEPKTPIDTQTPFSYSMEGANLTEQTRAMPYTWSPGWNSNQSIFKFQEEIGGVLANGDQGVVLPWIARPETPTPTTDQPRSAAPDFRLLPRPQLFGSEELSAHAPAIQNRAPHPLVTLNPQDASQLGVTAGDGVRMGAHTLEVEISETIGPGLAAVSVGMREAPAYLPDTPVTLSRDPDFVKPPTIIARG